MKPAAIVSAVLWFLALAPLPAGAQAPSDSSPDTASVLPVRSVALFSSGVAYVERAGQVDGNATVPLSFPTAGINDLLKSLVLLDENGQVQPVIYGARDPVSRTLQSFAVDVTQPQSRAQLLGSLRGGRVAVTTATGQTLTGQIISVEERTVGTGDKAATVQTLVLLTDLGLQSVGLDDARAIRLLDARQDREFREALTVLAAGSDNQRRPVTLRFAGTGRRTVRVGYVAEAPLWKISYRLLLGENQNGSLALKDGPLAPNNGKASEGFKSLAQEASSLYLQGWALVENTSDDDWNGIHLSLVSGRPVSFIQDLYQPLYLPRPVVPPDVVASPYPQTHGGNLQEDRDAANVPAPAPEAPAMPEAAPRYSAADAAGGVTSKMEQKTRSQPNNLYQFPGLVYGQPGRSVTAQAQGSEAGEQYAYDITTPVTLPRQQAAMIPVVAQSVTGRKVLLYSADSDPTFPLDAVQLKNDTGLHLKGGPVTLFDAGTYAGDARMEDVAPGDTRLISYALDLSVRGERQGQGQVTTETHFSLRRGVLVITTRERQMTVYTFKSQATGPRTLLVEHPFRSDWTLTAPAKADERTADVYRFALTLVPGKPQTLKVTEEQPTSSVIALLDADLNEIVAYASRTDIAPETRSALQEVVRRRRGVQELTSQAAQREAEIAAITAEQDRIRKNMAALDHASPLYKRYVSELDAQETRIATLQQEATRLRAQAADAQMAFRAYLDTLTL